MDELLVPDTLQKRCYDAAILLLIDGSAREHERISEILGEAGVEIGRLNRLLKETQLALCNSLSEEVDTTGTNVIKRNLADSY